MAGNRSFSRKKNENNKKKCDEVFVWTIYTLHFCFLSYRKLFIFFGVKWCDIILRWKLQNFRFDRKVTELANK